MAGENKTIEELEKEVSDITELLEETLAGYEEMDQEFQQFVASDPMISQLYEEFIEQREKGEEIDLHYTPEPEPVTEEAFDSTEDQEKMQPGEIASEPSTKDAEKPDTTELLAADLEAFGRDFAPYEYADTFDAANFDRTVEQLVEGSTEEIADWLKGILDENPENQEARDLLERVESMSKAEPVKEETMPEEERTAPKPDKMDCLLIKKGCYPERVTIDNTLESLQSSVGGLIQEFYFAPDDVAIVCNDEGKINGMEPNRAIRDEDNRVYDVIFGDFLVVGLTEEDFGYLTPEQMDRYDEMFHQPEEFIDIAGHICVIPVLPEDEQKPEEKIVDEQKMPEADIPEGRSR